MMGGVGLVLGLWVCDVGVVVWRKVVFVRIVLLWFWEWVVVGGVVSGVGILEVCCCMIVFWVRSCCLRM